MKRINDKMKSMTLEEKESRLEELLQVAGITEKLAAKIKEEL